MKPKIEPDKIFEILITLILRRNGFDAVLPKHLICGRSESHHQLDSVGLYLLQIPFVLPIIVIAEAKLWRTETVGIPVVRNILGVLQDLRETLPNKLLPPRKWPSDFYGSKISANYLGAVFTNNEFGKDAEKFALSNGIFLVPIPIDSLWVDKIIEKLEYLHNRRRCQENCVDSVDHGWKILDLIFSKSYGELDENQVKILVDIIQAIIDRCPDFAELKKEIYALRLGSVDGYPAAIQISKNALESLYDFTLKVENKKQTIGDRRFELSLEKEFGLKTWIKVRKTWTESVKKDITKENFENLAKIYVLKMPIPGTKELATMFLSETVVRYLEEQKNATISIPLSRSLVSQIIATFDVTGSDGTYRIVFT